jgi:CheY-like chemotaxis protein
MIYSGAMTDDNTSGKSVLIVDDENMNMFALTHILRSEYTVYAAKNGQSAIRIAKKQMPDVILLDILMPEMDGYEVLSLLKSDEETRKIPVIFVTGLISPEDEKKGLEMGAADYINKPFNSDTVRMKIHNQIEILNQAE